MLLATQLFVTGLYLPPVFRPALLFSPPHTTISLPVHTAVCEYRGVGALIVPVAVQLSVLGSYFPPVFTQLPHHIHPTRSFRSRSTPLYASCELRARRQS